MKPEAYKQATPIIKQIEEFANQINTVKSASGMKITISSSEIGIGLNTVGDEGLSNVRSAILNALESRKKQLEAELDKL